MARGRSCGWSLAARRATSRGPPTGTDGSTTWSGWRRPLGAAIRESTRGRRPIAPTRPEINREEQNDGQSNDVVRGGREGPWRAEGFLRGAVRLAADRHAGRAVLHRGGHGWRNPGRRGTGAGGASRTRHLLRPGGRPGGGAHEGGVARRKAGDGADGHPE